VLDPAYKEHVNPEATQEVFYSLTASALKTLSGVVACLLDGPLSRLSKNDWSRLTEVGDQSTYVVEMQRSLKLVFPIVRKRLEDAPFRQFCDKFVRAFLLRYQASIYRCKKVGEMGAQQLLLDAQAIRSMLLSAPSIRPASDKALAALAADKPVEEDEDAGAGHDEAPAPPPAVYAKFVQKEVPRVELLLKIISTPRERFADTIKALWGEASESELTRVMDLKGMNKKEQADILVALGRARPSAANALPSMAGLTMNMGSINLSNLGTMMGAPVASSGSGAGAVGAGSGMGAQGSASGSGAGAGAGTGQGGGASSQAGGGIAAAAAKVGKISTVANLFGAGAKGKK
jgi:hypothetical protein